MTVIVGLKEKGKIYMGADSASIGGWRLTKSKEPKLFKVGGLLIGLSGSPRISQALKYSFKPPDHPYRMPNEEYMITLFVDAVRKRLKDAGCEKIENSVEEFGRSVFLIGYKGELYSLWSNFQIGTSRRSYSAIGCGEEFAYGALFCLDKYDMTPREKIKQALMAANEHSAGVSPPFTYMEN